MVNSNICTFYLILSPIILPITLTTFQLQTFNTSSLAGNKNKLYFPDPQPANRAICKPVAEQTHVSGVDRKCERP